MLYLPIESVLSELVFWLLWGLNDELSGLDIGLDNPLEALLIDEYILGSELWSNELFENCPNELWYL